MGGKGAYLGIEAPVVDVIVIALGQKLDLAIVAVADQRGDGEMHGCLRQACGARLEQRTCLSCSLMTRCTIGMSRPLIYAGAGWIREKGTNVAEG